MSDLKGGLMPKHVGIIMDGNRRWAEAKGLSPLKGHDKGYKNLREISLYLFTQYKVPCISVFVFSTENWSRSEKEVGHLMKLVHRALRKYLDEFHKDNIRLVVLGRRDQLNPDIIEAIEEAEATTKNNTKGTLALCFNYGGQAEIIDAARSLVAQGLRPEDINQQTFEQNIYHPEVPPLDLIIRTSGEHRLSGFMWWRSVYAELIFVDKHWPDFGPADVDAALEEFGRRQRRFGQ